MTKVTNVFSQDSDKHSERGGCGGPAEDVEGLSKHRVNTHEDLRQSVRSPVGPKPMRRGGAGAGEASGRQGTPRAARGIG